MHPGMPRELEDATVRPGSVVFDESRQLTEGPIDRREANVNPDVLEDPGNHRGAYRNLVKFNKDKHKVLHSGRNSHRHLHMLEVGGKRSGRKGPGGPGGHQVEREPAVGPCSQKGKWYPGLH